MNYERIADIVREEILQDYVPNVCILAARVTTLALRHFGIDCQAMAVELEALSPAYIEMLTYLDQVKRKLTDDEFAKYAERGAWRVSLSFDRAPEGVVDRRDNTGYHGHVVTLAEGRRWLIDPTLPQVNRPEKGLVVEPPFAYEVNATDRNLRDERIGMSTGNGTHVIYELLPGRRDFTKAPDWRAPGPRKPIMDRVLGRIIERIEEVEHAAHH